MKKFLNALKWFLNSYIWIFPLFLAVDIITKNVVASNMTEGQSIPLIEGFLHITYTINTKAAFSMGFPDNLAWLNKLIYIIIAVGASVGVIFYYIKKNKKINGYIKACLMLILTGAIGNLIDRIFYSAKFLNADKGGVVDFIDFCGIWHAIFNIADCCIVIAVFMLLIYYIIDMVKDYKKNAEKDKAKEVLISKTEQSMDKKEKDNDISR